LIKINIPIVTSTFFDNVILFICVVDVMTEHENYLTYSKFFLLISRIILLLNRPSWRVESWLYIYISWCS